MIVWFGILRMMAWLASASIFKSRRLPSRSTSDFPYRAARYHALVDLPMSSVFIALGESIVPGT